MTDEKTLVRKSQQGDRAAFALLMRRYGDKILRLSTQICRTAPAEADDVYQDTFLTAMKKIAAFRSNASLGTWLYRIAANQCWMKLRRQKSRPQVALEKPSSTQDFPIKRRAARLADASADPAAQARKKELKILIARALESVPANLRTVLVLSDIEELSNQDIAKRLSLSLPAVKSRLLRGRALLKSRITKLLK